ncbi:alpha beta hydrolase family domain-containing [Trichoderma cornu-damae]|uniref:Alpha beta hydrolase family domain-containing n=1 Tax=Trichoderma cornu-damae TaxID=654480 RepID=A0A9P8QJT0_9HYPO|nr:alpha beta hydrolase family domain-containing [Trichoderma cornu-damae]
MTAIPSPKPHIFIIPGAWHTASHMEAFVKSLEAAGFSAESVSLRSVGNRDVTVRDDEAQVKSLLGPHFDEGKEVVIVAHSYGGMVGTGVIADMDKGSRGAQGLKGGVVGIAYLSAHVPLENETCHGMYGNQWASWVNTDDIESKGVLLTRDEKDIFYNDLSDEASERAVAALKPHSVVSAMSYPSAIGWKDEAYDGRRGYIRCLKDNAISPSLQDQFMARSGVDWVVRSIESSHSPFLSMPDELAETVAEMVTEFAKN